MNLGALAPAWILWLLTGLLAVAALQDSARLRISNLLPIAILLLGFVAIALVGPAFALWQNLLVFVATLTLGTLLFGMGRLGGGDVKLLAATALWFDLGGAWRFVLAVMIAGGVLALLVLAVRMIGWSEAARRRFVILTPKGGIPYGVAIAAGAVLALLLVRSADAPARPLDNWTLARPQ